MVFTESRSWAAWRKWVCPAGLGAAWEPQEVPSGANAPPRRETGRETVIYSLTLPFAFPPCLPTGLLESQETRQPWKYWKSAPQVRVRGREAENASERKWANNPYDFSLTFRQLASPSYAPLQHTRQRIIRTCILLLCFVYIFASASAFWSL